MEQRRAVVLGATGAVGRAVTAALLARGARTRVVSRNPEALTRAFGATNAERVAADLVDEDAAFSAIKGCVVAFHCVGLPLARFGDHLPIARSVILALKRTGARCVLVSSGWSYAPFTRRPIREDDPRETEAGPIVAIRRKQENAFQKAGAAVACLPDLYGPGVRAGAVTAALEQLITQRRVLWPGALDAQKDFLYAPDAGPPIVTLALRKAAYARRWLVPGSLRATARELLERTMRLAEHEVELCEATPCMVRLAAGASADAHAFSQVYFIQRCATVFDGSRLRELIGPWPETGVDAGLKRAIESARAGRGSEGASRVASGVAAAR